MRPILAVFTLLIAVLAFSPGSVLAQEQQEAERAELGNVPMFWIVEVVQNESVTIETANMPANRNFTVRMGPMGSLAIDGAQVSTT
jgi:hypothetical protein